MPRDSRKKNAGNRTLSQNAPEGSRKRLESKTKTVSYAKGFEKKGRKSNLQPKCARGFEKTLRKFEPSAENAQNLEPFVRQKKVPLQAARRSAWPPGVRENVQNHESLAKMRQRVRENAQNLEPSATLCLATKGTGFLELWVSQRQPVRKFAAASPTRC